MTDWSPLTEDGTDPVPGSPDGVHRVQATWRQLSDSVEQSDALLQRLGTATSWKGEAATLFAHGLGELKRDLPKLSRSMDRAAWGLSVYEGQLREAQGQARRALTMAVEGSTQIGRARSAGSSPGQDPAAYHTLEEQGRQVLDAARTLRDQARHLRDQAVTTCIQVIEGAERVGMRNTLGSYLSRHVVEPVADAASGAWASQWGWFDAHAHAISTWCGRIGMVLGVLSVVTCWMPVLSGPLRLASLVVGLVGVAADARMARTGASGTTWAGVGFSFVLTVGSFGVGKLLGKAAAAAHGEELEASAEKLTSWTTRLRRYRTGLSEAQASGRSARSIGGSKSWVTRAERQVASAESGYRDTHLASLMHGKVGAEDLAVHEHLATKVTKIDYAIKHPVRVASLYFGPAHLWRDVPASVQWQRANASVKLAKSMYSVSHTLPRWLDAGPPRSAGGAPVPAH